MPSYFFYPTLLARPPVCHPTQPPPALPRSYNALLADRAELEARYEARLRGAEASSAAQLAALDAQFQQKMLHEMDRYAELAAGKEALNARWVRQGGGEWVLGVFQFSVHSVKLPGLELSFCSIGTPTVADTTLCPPPQVGEAGSGAGGAARAGGGGGGCRAPRPAGSGTGALRRAGC